MQQRSLWMRPALQMGEAVLLPALMRRLPAELLFSNRYSPINADESPFRPVPAEGEQPVLALSTYVRPRGSMAGRSVLRAAGMTGNPFAAKGQPRYYMKKSAYGFSHRWGR